MYSPFPGNKLTYSVDIFKVLFLEIFKHTGKQREYNKPFVNLLLTRYPFHELPVVLVLHGENEGDNTGPGSYTSFIFIFILLFLGQYLLGLFIFSTIGVTAPV